ncbi:hypothetical protein BDM02DRAFT_2821025 [Thelephora ganbajun]|uniref:Uncharacterized protein n=1 Tax=Thelephora ganbajun TaxID=370292 RepID=A0ACB6ZBR1_THEGA|nr:hypothetical protein BDM02DRAFT_2821025 [Thelephora ganbajun]
MDQLPPLDNTLGAALIGVIVSAALYGVSCAQVFYYFQHYSKKDGRGTKAVVVAALISDTIHQALISHTIYTYLVTNYYKPQKLNDLVWSLVVEVLFNGITALLVQSFYAVRVWKFSQRNLLITVILAVFIVAEFVSVVVYVAKGIHFRTFTELHTLKPLSMTVNVLAVVGDVLITVVFCILLSRARSSVQRSNTMITLLIAFSVQTGMLTSLCAVASLVTIIASPNTFIYICFYFLLGRLYCNSLLATLNVRKAIRGRGHVDLGISLRPIEDSNSSTVDNHKVIDIEAEIADIETHGYITGFKAHGCNGSSSFVQSMSHPNNSRVVKTESELESGRPRHLRRASF